MGIALWLGGGTAAFFLARIVPLRRGSGWLAELALALLAAFALGVAATAMDFGGWAVGDWRAFLFALIGAFGVLGLGRAVRN